MLHFTFDKRKLRHEMGFLLPELWWVPLNIDVSSKLAFYRLNNFSTIMYSMTTKSLSIKLDGFKHVTQSFNYLSKCQAMCWLSQLIYFLSRTICMRRPTRNMRRKELPFSKKLPLRENWKSDFTVTSTE